MDSLRKLEEIFARFPGIGPRQAKRFAYYLLGKPPAFIKEFTALIEEVKKATSQCDKCARLFIHKNGKGATCSVCADPGRDSSTLMVVARDSDFETVEKSGAYKGLYFILGGTVPILDNEPEKRIRLKQLLERVSELNNGAGAKESDSRKSGLKEVILSLNATSDGEHTAQIVRDALGHLIKDSPLYSSKVSVLGRGLSTGAELEYVDGETIRNALQNRT